MRIGPQIFYCSRATDQGPAPCSPRLLLWPLGMVGTLGQACLWDIWHSSYRKLCQAFFRIALQSKSLLSKLHFFLPRGHTCTMVWWLSKPLQASPLFSFTGIFPHKFLPRSEWSLLLPLSAPALPPQCIPMTPWENQSKLRYSPECPEHPFGYPSEAAATTWELPII